MSYNKVTIILALQCALILGYIVRIFRAIDAKYIMFRVGWRKFLKGSATPDVEIKIFIDWLITSVLAVAQQTIHFDRSVDLIYLQLMFTELCNPCEWN